MKRNLKKIIGILMIILAIGCVAYIGYSEYQKKQNADVYTRVQKEVKDNKKKLDKKNDGETEQEYVSPVDFTSLQQSNADIYAWIEIPETSINYPIVQKADDDSYYLNHTIEGKEGYPGSIYTESLNAEDFSDYNTVIYGHNMKDGSMFHGLHAYEDSQYLQKHPYVYIYTPTQKITYKIFACVVYSNAHILNCYDFSDAYQKQLYLDSVYASRDMKNSIDESVQVGTDDRILTLSTCISGQSDNRYIVEAVRIDE